MVFLFLLFFLYKLLHEITCTLILLKQRNGEPHQGVGGGSIFKLYTGYRDRGIEYGFYFYFILSL